MMNITFDLKCSTFTVKCPKWPVFVMDNWNALHICETFQSILSLKSFMFVVQRMFQLSCSNELGLLNRTNNTDFALLLHIRQTRNSCKCIPNMSEDRQLPTSNLTAMLIFC